jgi:hypothetical protein
MFAAGISALPDCIGAGADRRYKYGHAMACPYTLHGSAERSPTSL